MSHVAKNVLLVSIIFGAGGAQLFAIQPVSFSHEVQPILAEFCFQCHGPDQHKREAGLRLDRQKGLFDKLDSGSFPVVANDVQRSEMMRRMISSDKDLQMPPSHISRRPTREQITTIKRWIAEGARWQKHWAYRAPVRESLPNVRNANWAINLIDYFTLARMENASLQPSPPSDREQWIRRATFDLTGLPPTLDEIDDFLSDHSPDAAERVVDRLLASPKYGERMAAHWMDLARYADTHGYNVDSHRDMWRWREWVIDALNENMPFDQFTIWQIAGDLLPDATLEQRIATGFHRNHMINSEGGVIPEEFQTEYVIDRVVTTSTVWLGQTMLCARCHVHKFDPFTQRDFYRLAAYFNNVPEQGVDGREGNAAPFIKAPTRLQQEKLQRFDFTLRSLRAKMDVRDETKTVARLKWETSARANRKVFPKAPSDATVRLPFDELIGQEGWLLDVGPKRLMFKIDGEAVWQSDGKIDGALVFTPGTYVEAKEIDLFSHDDKFSISLWVNPTTQNSMTIMSRMDDAQRGFKLALVKGKVAIVLAHDQQGDALELVAKKSLDEFQWHHLTITYDGSSRASGLRLFVNGSPVNVEVQHDNLSGKTTVSEPLVFSDRVNKQPFRGMMDDVRFFDRQLSETEVSELARTNPIAEILHKPRDERSASESARLRRFYLRRHDPKYRELSDEYSRVFLERSFVKSEVPTTMVMQEMSTPRPTHILKRGNYRHPGERVFPDTPSALPRLANARPDRLGLARWLVDRRNPLTTRVTVNRIWQVLLGEGLVRTPEDFGTRGERPTHPRLLDRLAVDFMDGGWDVKQLQKQIVLSATYRQQSVYVDDRLRLDPANRVLSRGTRYRWPAEFIRDNALEIGGLLHHRLGGKSVYPYQPRGLWKEVSYDPTSLTAQVFHPSIGEGLYRRTMYTFWKRAVPPPAQMALGATSREVCSVQRPRPSSPLDALVLMNDPTYVEAARGLAMRMMSHQDASRRQKLCLGFRLATGRRPIDEEVEVLTSVFAQQLADFRRGDRAAMQLLNVGNSPFDKSLDASVLATYTIIASMLLNLEETITKG